jgi:hypothetical protein
MPNYFLQIKRWVKRTIFSALGKPYLDVQLRANGKEIELDIDYNAAFIRYLDTLGYNDIIGADAKIDAYIQDVMNVAVKQENIEGEGEDEQALPPMV